MARVVTTCRLMVLLEPWEHQSSPRLLERKLRVRSLRANWIKCCNKQMAKGLQAVELEPMTSRLELPQLLALQLRQQTRRVLIRTKPLL